MGEGSSRSALPLPDERIPFSAGYLAVVVALAGVNAWFMASLIRRMSETGSLSAATVLLSVVFGILFAGACNMTANTIARKLGRRQIADRVVFFLLLECLCLTLLVLVFTQWGGVFGPALAP